MPADDAQTVTVTIQNNGPTAWTQPIIVSRTPGTNFAFASVVIPAGVASGDSRVVTLFVRAPLATGLATLGLTLDRSGTAQTAAFTFPVTVDNAAPQLRATFTDDLPASLLPGEQRYMTVTVTNAGTVSWTTDYQLRLTTPDGRVRTANLPAVASGASTNVRFLIVAPAIENTYEYTIDILRNLPNPAGGYFGEQHVISLIVGGANAIFSANFDSIVSTTTLFQGGASYVLNVQVSNNGNTTWQSDTTFRFIQRSDTGGADVCGPGGSLESFCTSTPRTMAQRTDGVATTVAPGGTITFSFTNQSPPTAGVYTWTLIAGNSAGDLSVDTQDITVLGASTTVSRTFAPTNDVQVFGVVNLPSVAFTTADFPLGALVRDVDVSINWNKVAGTCAAPVIGGDARYVETSFTLTAPTAPAVRVVRNSPVVTYEGTVSQGFLTTTFDQDSANTITPGNVPTAGTFRSASTSLNSFDLRSPFGNWFLQAISGPLSSAAPVCVRSYTVTITAF